MRLLLHLFVVSALEDEDPPPLPPSRSASIRPEASPAAGNPPRPPRPRPRPTQTQENNSAPNASTVSQADESSNSVAALREAVFGEKRNAHPPVLQKSTVKTPQKKKIDTPIAETQKSSVLKIAAALEESKQDIFSSSENSGDKSTVVERPPVSTPGPVDSRKQQLEGRSAYPSQPSTTLARQTHPRNVNKLSTLNQQSEDASGAPYEVPKQGSTHSPSSVSTNMTHKSSTSMVHRKLSAESDSGHSEVGRVKQNQPQSKIQSSLSTSLQTAIAKQTLNREQSTSQFQKSETEAKSCQNFTHSQSSIQKNTSEVQSSQLSSQISNPSQQPDSTLLERIRQRKAARAQMDNINGLADDSVNGMSKDPNSNVQNPIQCTPKQNTVTKDRVHSMKPPLPDPSIGNSRRDSRQSSLRRSSSNLSARRISGESTQNVSSDDGCKQSRQKGLHRSPTSVSQWLKDTKPLEGSGNHIHTSHKRLQRSPSNHSRQSSDDSPPRLPPRSAIQADTDQGQNSAQSSKAHVKDTHQYHQTSTKKHLLLEKTSSNTSLSVTPAMADSKHANNCSSSSVEESVVLADFISRYSGALPLAVSVQNAESVSSQRLVATRQCNNFNVHFIKHSKVVIIHDCFGGECFSVPLNSCVKFGLIYDQQSESNNTDHATHFETAGEIMSLKQLPYVICATKQFDGGSLEKSVATGEVLFVRGVKRAKAIGRGRCLKVNSISGDEKLLGSKCSGGFTTSPHECQLNLLAMMEHSIPLPQQAMLFSNTEISSYLPQTMIDNPITLEKIQGESSAIMTPRNAEEAESWMYDVSTEIKLWVKKLPLSTEEQEDLNAETNVFYTTFDPLYTQHYAEKSNDDGIALQHVLIVNAMPGKEKEGVHLYLPNSNMMPTEVHNLSAEINSDLNRGRTSILGDLERTVADETEHNTTYAVHIAEQRSMKSSRSSVEIMSIASANTEHSEESSYIPPTEDSDVEQEEEDGDEPEEAYEEVMSALANVQEEQSDREPTGPRKMGKLVGMFKSVKQSLTKTHKEESNQTDTANDDAAIEEASPSPEPEDYDRISFTDDIAADKDKVSGPVTPPPLPNTSQIAGRRPPQIAPPPPPLEQSATTSIALQRLMAAAKITPASSANVSEKEKEEEQEGYQPVRVDDEMFEDEESGYSDVRSLNIDIPSVIAAKQASIAVMLGKRKPPLPPPAKEESPEPSSHKPMDPVLSSLTIDKAEPTAQNIQRNSSTTHSSSGGSTEGDYMRLRSLYSGLQTQVSQLTDEVSVMKASIEQLSHMVEELMQVKDIKQDSVHPTKTQTLPRRKKITKVK